MAAGHEHLVHVTGAEVGAAQLHIKAAPSAPLARRQRRALPWRPARRTPGHTPATHADQDGTNACWPSAGWAVFLAPDCPAHAGEIKRTEHGWVAQAHGPRSSDDSNGCYPPTGPIMKTMVGVTV